jgi:hypothetical protein
LFFYIKFSFLIILIQIILKKCMLNNWLQRNQLVNFKTVYA